MESNEKYLFIITSVIYFPSRPLSYSETRSVFSESDRALQTFETIKSIRNRFKDVKIILFESGLKKELPYNLDEFVDEYIYLGGKFFMRWACDSKYKGLGEAVALIYAKKHLLNKADFYFKISGRYYLTDEFNLCSWDKKCFNAKKFNYNISTRLYGFPSAYIKKWHYFLIKNLIPLFYGKSMEDVMTKFCNKKTNYIKQLGVSGQIGPSGGLIVE